MSQLRIITRPAIVAGYHLAGADAYGADDEDEVRHLILKWMADGASGLVAVDERLLARLDRAVWRQLETYRRLHLLALPSGEPSPPGITARARIADLIRQAIGYHITFAGEEA